MNHLLRVIAFLYLYSIGMNGGLLHADESPLTPQSSASNPKLLIGFNSVKWKGTTFAEGDGIWKIALLAGEKKYPIFQIENESATETGGYQIILKAKGDDAPRVALEFEPVFDQILSRKWTGFRYRYRVLDALLSGLKIEESHRWQLEETGQKPEYWIRNVFLATEYIPGVSPEFSTSPEDSWHSRFGKIDPLDFHEGNGHALMVYPEEISLILNRSYADKNTIPTIVDRFVLTPETKSTPWKRVIFTTQWPKEKYERINQFNHLWLTLRNYYKGKAVLAPASPIEPAVILGPRLSQIEPLLPKVKELGFKVISVGPIWTSSATEDGKRSSMSVYNFTVATKWGGLRELNHLCEKASAQGIKVFAWFPSFHLSDQSPLLAIHPEWKARPSRPDLYKDQLIPLNLANPELRKQMMEQLQEIRNAGLAGFWLDSYHNFGIEALEQKENWDEPLLPQFLSTLHDLQSLGFTLYAEGYTPLIVPSFGLIGGRVPFYAGTEYRLLAASPYPDDKKGGSQLNNINYFAFLSFGSPLLLSCHLWNEKEELWAFSEEQQKNFASWHRQYNQAVTDMNHLHGYVEEGKGVLWNGKDANVVFVLKDFTAPSEEDLKIIDLSTGTTLPDHSLLKANTVYRLQGNLPKTWTPPTP